jgi:tRNA A-37 threonylcarbamoyl transferase component Bud32
VLESGDTLVGKYRIESVIGQGAYGKVYLGHDPAMDRHVAIKELLRVAGEDAPTDWQEHRRRFALEAEVVSQLSHPNVVTTHALESDAEGNLYLITEYVEGGSLRDALQDGPLEVERAIAIALDIGRAIEAIYRYDIVHRDIKPSNILIDGAGRAKLTDFGVAQVGRETRRTQEGAQHPGTPAYMSPEQATSAGYLDQRSDLYALGLVLYEMLTGQLYVRNRVAPHRVNPQVPLALSLLVLRALEEDPGRRYQSAEALCADLERVRDQSLVGQANILMRRVTGRRLLVAGAVVLALLLVVNLARISAALQSQTAAREDSAADVTASSPAAAMAMLPPPEGMRQALLVAPEDAHAVVPAAAALVGEPASPEGAGSPQALALPGTISIGERQTRVFEHEGVPHSVVFRVKAGQTYLVSTSNLATGVDTRLEVVVDQRMHANDDIAPGTLASQVVFTAQEDGTAEVTVHNQDRFGPGRTYDLSVIMVEMTPTPTGTPAPEVTPTVASPTPQPTIAQSTPTPRPTFTLRPTWTPALVTTRTPTITLTPSPTWTRRPTWTLVPTWTRTPTMTATLSGSITPTPTATPTGTLTVIAPPTATPTALPTGTPTPTPLPTSTPLPTADPNPPSQ